LPIIKGTSTQPKTKKQKASDQFQMTSQVAGTKKAIKQAVGQGTYELVSGEASPSYGKWKSGAEGKWKAGAEGQWQDGSTGKWKAGAESKWKQGATGRWVQGTEGGDSTGGRTRPGGFTSQTGLSSNYASGHVGSQNEMYHSDGSFFRSDNSNESESGLGGGGGTGSGTAAATSALKGVNTKTQGRSVEEFVKGAKRTRKTGGKRTQ
jgi:hypothetical protein